MSRLVSLGAGLSALACSAEECLCWIIVLLNLLTVFYLVFCAWFRITKAVRIAGYVWGALLAVGTVAIVALHTCLFTVLSAVFSALILMAVLSAAFDKGADKAGGAVKSDPTAPGDTAPTAPCRGVIFTEEKKTLWELYAALSPEQRAYFDGVRARAEGKENSRAGAAQTTYTVFCGREKIVKLRIRKEKVEAVFTVTDSAFCKLSDESGAAVKAAPTVIRIESERHYRLALQTVDYRYAAILAEKEERKRLRRKAAQP